jgi:hypothetical protein
MPSNVCTFLSSCYPSINRSPGLCTVELRL